jgi:glycosyltransferase involved in cell wall biosynthesis
MKKKILVSIDWYLPGYKAGGPIKSCANIIRQLKDEFDFSVITSDTDFSDTQPYPHVKPNEWNILEDGTRVFYFSGSNSTYDAMKAVIEQENPDVLYMNSFFSRNFTLLPLKIVRKSRMKCQCIIAPRGMLGAGALAIKPLKKLAFISWSKMVGTFDHIRWHASTDQEAKEIRAIFGSKANVYVALNLSSAHTGELKQKQKSAGQLNLLFFSRVSRKKNLHLVLQWLLQMPSDINIVFDIYGTLEDESYWKECNELIAQLPSHIKAFYKGVVAAPNASKVFDEHHFSILPTMHENYGHAIIESLAHGVPVILSNNTPWQDLYQKHAGYVLPLDNPMAFVQAIKDAAQFTQEEFNVWQQAASDYATPLLNNADAVKQNKKLFND